MWSVRVRERERPRVELRQRTNENLLSENIRKSHKRPEARQSDVCVHCHRRIYTVYVFLKWRLIKGNIKLRGNGVCGAKNEKFPPIAVVFLFGSFACAADLSC